jgi:hypothetical protein
MILHWLAVPWRIKPPVLILAFSILFSLLFDILLVLYFYANFSLVIVGAAGAGMALWQKHFAMDSNHAGITDKNGYTTKSCIDASHGKSGKVKLSRSRL